MVDGCSNKVRSRIDNTFPIHTILLILFFLSGVCGLIYEVVWSRMLTLVMGNTVFATSTVLAAFMGGLALGSWLLGRFVDRYGRPLILYGSLECLLGLYCLILPALLQGMVPIYRFLYQPFHASPYLLILAQLFFSGLLIVVPSALMGGTLPVLSKFLVRRHDHIGSTVGRLYAINTIGAVVGVVAAGFVLLPGLGIRASLYGAAAVNLLIGGFAFGLAFILREKSAPQPAQVLPPRSLFHSSDESSREARLALLAFTVSGGAALIYEVAWTRSLSLLLGPSVQAFALMLGAFITGLALGSWLFSRVADREKELLPLFGLLQWGVAFSAVAFIPLVNYFPGFIRGTLRSASVTFSEVQLLNAGLVFLIMLVPTTCLGAVFPLAVNLYSRSISSLGKRLGTLYAGNTMGAVVGSLSAGFLLIPFLGLQKTILAAALINGAMGGLLLLASGIRRQRVRISLAAVPALALLGIVFLMPPWDTNQLTSGPYTYLYKDEATARKTLAGEELLYYREGVTGTVAVKKRGNAQFLVISGKVDAGSREDMLTQILSGQIPLLLAKNPEDILVIGLASGVTLGAVAQHPVKAIDVVEISYEVREAASLFSEVNHDVLKDERVDLIIQDGRNHLLLTDRLYDVIISAPSNPWMAGIGNLYTAEFFKLARERLRPGGLMGQWLGAYNIPNSILKSIIRTYASVFPHVSLWAFDDSDLLLVGSESPIRINVEDLKKRLANEKVRADLRRINSHRWWQPIMMAVAEGDILRRAVQDAPIHTDDHPFLEYELPKSLRTETRLENAAWIGGLIKQGAQPSPARGSVVVAAGDLEILARAQAVVARQYERLRRRWVRVSAERQRVN
jgi:spermidine synthase